MKLRKIIGMVAAVAVTLANVAAISVPTAFAESKPAIGKIAAVDRDGNPVTDINNVPVNLWAIQIPFGCTLDPATANVSTITFVSEYGNKIAYRAKIEKNSYYIYFDEDGILESGTKYQITIPGTVANTEGAQLGQGRKFTLTMAGSKPKPVIGTIAAVDKDRNPVTDIENVPLNLWAIQIPVGCTLDSATANTDTITFKDENGTVIAYRAKIEKNSYYIYLDEEGVLESGTQYQITVPATIANTAGDELGQEFKFNFKTEGSAVEPAPVVGKIVAVDKDSNPVTDINNVPLNLWAIQIPFGCTLDSATANTDTITFKDENGTVIDYRAKIEKNSYYIYLDEEGVLESGTQYQITVPATVANTAGDELGQEFKFKFTTVGAVSDGMSISSVKVNDEAVESLSAITAGSTVVVAVENNSGETMNSVAMMVFRKNHKIVNLLMSEQQVETGTEEQDVFAFEVPSDMSEIDEVSVLLWNDLEEIVPYCSKVSIK